jgi:hypothetical protein
MAPARCLERTVPNESVNPFAGIFPLPPPKHAARKAESWLTFTALSSTTGVAAQVSQLRRGADSQMLFNLLAKDVIPITDRIPAKVVMFFALLTT